MKQTILARMDLKMPKGKLSVQVAHASVAAVLKSKENKVDEWEKQGMKKVVLKVENLRELKKYYKQAKKAKLTAEIIRDAGKTFLIPGTITCCAIGPDEEEKIDKITGKLKIL